MNRSDGVAQATKAIFRALDLGDADAFSSAMSRSADFIGIGTDPNEWWVGSAGPESVIRAQLGEAGGRFPIEADEPIAYESGDLGWSATMAQLKMPEVPAVGTRLTCVFWREDGAWKLVHFHFSIGVANEEALGVELTTSA